MMKIRRLIRDWTGLAAMLLATLILAGPQPAMAADLNGRFKGVDDAEGFRMDIYPSGGGVAATLYDPVGNQGSFSASRDGAAANGVLDIAGQRYLVRLAPHPIGIQVVTVPLLDEGLVVSDEAKTFAMVRENVQLPPKPEIFVNPPTRLGETVDPILFLHSYAFWDAAGVGAGYAGLPPRFRTLMRLFPLLQTDVLWKMCQAPNAAPALGEALRGQGVTCAQILSTMSAAQSSGGFSRFKQDVEVEKAVTLDAVRCGQTSVFDPSKCKSVSKRTSQAAIRMETAATVIGRYR